MVGENTLAVERERLRAGATERLTSTVGVAKQRVRLRQVVARVTVALGDGVELAAERVRARDRATEQCTKRTAKQCHSIVSPTSMIRLDGVKRCGRSGVRLRERVPRERSEWKPEKKKEKKRKKTGAIPCIIIIIVVVIIIIIIIIIITSSFAQEAHEKIPPAAWYACVSLTKNRSFSASPTSTRCTVIAQPPRSSAASSVTNTATRASCMLPGPRDDWR